MLNSFQDILNHFNSNSPPSAEIIEQVEQQIGHRFPSDYTAFMSERDGGEGFIGDNYLVLWPIGRLLEFNRGYKVQMYAPGLVLFGSNGGGEGFAFDARSQGNLEIRVVPFIGMSLQDAIFVANTFEQFLVRLAKPNSSLFD